MDTERRSITRPDGRTIDFLVAGPATGLPLVLHEGTPGGLVLYPPTVRAARMRGLRVVLAARPGYEGSTPRPGRRVADVAEDTAAVLDELGADTFVTAGWSGGGPHALACAAALPGRCLAAASIAGVAPHAAKGLDWLAGMGPENVAEFGATVRGEAALTEFLDHEAAMLSTLTGESVAESLGDLVIEADQAVLTGEFADHVAASLRASMNSGIAGWRDDDLAFVKDWGFSLGWESPGLESPGLESPAQMSAPVAVWQGDQDRMVPFAHGQWLAANIRGARVHLMPGDGHLSMTVSAFDRILDDLLDLAGLSPAP
jgi:pimeloyl-ACP methyl ester carboxylesterase